MGFHSIRPTKIQAYSTCLAHVNKIKRNVPKSISAGACNQHLKNSCNFCDGEREYECFRRLHQTEAKVYSLNAAKDSFQGSLNFNSTSIQLRKQCLERGRDSVNECLGALIDKCRASTIRATKVIRLRMETIKSLLDKDPYVKVIHYVRDPRGILESSVRHNSQGHSSNKIMNDFAYGAVKLCSKIENDLEVHEKLAVLYPNNFMLLRYEDLVENTEESLKKIYGLLDLQIPDSVRMYMMSAFKSDKNGGAMQTFRKNGTKTAMQWQKKLNRDQIGLIQSICLGVMEKLGYPLVSYNYG